MVINHYSSLARVQSFHECGTSAGMRKSFGPRTVSWFYRTAAPSLAHDGFLLLNFVHRQTFQHLSQTLSFSLNKIWAFFVDRLMTLAGFACFFNFQHTTYTLVMFWNRRNSVSGRFLNSSWEFWAVWSHSAFPGVSLSFNIQYLNFISLQCTFWRSVLIKITAVSCVFWGAFQEPGWDLKLSLNINPSKRKQKLS